MSVVLVTGGAGGIGACLVTAAYNGNKAALCPCNALRLGIA